MTGFDTSVFFRFLIAALATWRVSFLLARERGPADILGRLRRAAGVGMLGDAIRCVKCTGLWVAIPFALFVGGGWLEVAVVWLALAGVAALIDECTRPPFEWHDSKEQSGARESNHQQWPAIDRDRGGIR